MLFVEALDLLEQGKYLVREVWTLADGFICLMPGMPLPWKIMPAPNAHAGVHALSRDELKANDWKEITYADLNKATEPASEQYDVIWLTIAG